MGILAWVVAPWLRDQLGGMGLVRGGRCALHLQHRARRGAALPGAAAATNAGCLWKVRLGREWVAFLPLPPARPVGDPSQPGGHRRSRLPLAAVPERLDG